MSNLNRGILVCSLPEVNETEHGRDIINNFLFKICIVRRNGNLRSSSTSYVRKSWRSTRQKRPLRRSGGAILRLHLRFVRMLSVRSGKRGLCRYRFEARGERQEIEATFARADGIT